MWRLNVQPFGETSFEHLMEGDSILLGRSRECDVTLHGKFTSRQHARLFRQDDALMVEDLDSHNGTRLNGQTVKTAVTVSSGDLLQIASCFITIDSIALPSAHIASALSQSSASLSGTLRHIT